ncbi:stage III sporulation protein AB [Anaerotignum lactatifermentans]|uniref:Stage III sporulation protein AB n=1 Tax=Anaerotignum lactatifermentans TaxID=160404 RepID=A0ABS2G6T3_9FIRM|nr:stage III sporulation protein AB [Anaerotignum lactatifermentans]MBM6876750.1 stage III sporulation protein AB [Anaerotignum lactatifermentans]
MTTTLSGAFFVLRERYRLADLKELERALGLLENHMAYLSEPLPEVFFSISCKTGGMVGLILQETAEEMARRQQETAEEIWERVWQKYLPKTYFTAVDLEAILHFGQTLGFLDQKQQVGSAKLLLGYLRETQASLQRKLEKNGRLYYGMGMLGGILLVVVLL